MVIVNYKIMQSILKITCSILKNNFFYEDDRIIDFLNIFSDVMSKELAFFETCADEDILVELEQSVKSRMHFTCYITSTVIREIFIHKFNFTDQELYAFDNILPKYTGEKAHENRPSYEGTHYRKYFK